MRLICPNCDAQYDVSDDAIPTGGRDVQCSSCAHTWYQTEKPIVVGREPSRVLSRPLPTAVKSEVREPVASAYDAPTNTAPDPHQKPKHRPIDPTVANILREEAAYVAETVTPEPAPPAKPETVTRHEDVDTGETLKRIAAMTELEGGTRTGTSAAQAAAAAAAATANPRAVPDIHEINAALRARAEASDQSGLTEAEHAGSARRSSFRFGFFGILLVMGLAVAPYIFSEEISANLPQAREPMANYVVMVDEWRIKLSELAATVVATISEVTG